MEAAFSNFYNNSFFNGSYELDPTGAIVLVVHVGFTVLYLLLALLIKTFRRWCGAACCRLGAAWEHRLCLSCGTKGLRRACLAAPLPRIIDNSYAFWIGADRGRIAGGSRSLGALSR